MTAQTTTVGRGDPTNVGRGNPTLQRLESAAALRSVVTPVTTNVIPNSDRLASQAELDGCGNPTLQKP